MNILQAHKFYWTRDGASNYFFYLSQLLRKSGHKVIPFSMKDPRNFSTEYEDFFVSPLDLSDPKNIGLFHKFVYGLRMLYSFEAKEKMEELLANERVDMAHIHNIYHHISPSILTALKNKNIPIVMTLHDYNLLCPNYNFYHHGAVHEEDANFWHMSCLRNKCVKDDFWSSVFGVGESIFQNKIMKYYLKNVDLFLSPSKFLMNKFVEHGWPREKIVQIPLPIDVNNFSVQEEDMGYVAYAGRLSEEKGISVLLDAAKSTPEIDYKIIGTGPMSDYLDKRINTENISNVELLGYKSGDDLKVLLSGARLVVLPSVWYENYPLGVLEAKATGKIVVASKIGGIPELLSDDFLVPPGDCLALADRISFWFNAPKEKRVMIGKKLRSEVEEKNSPEAHLRAICKVYNIFSRK